MKKLARAKVLIIDHLAITPMSSPGRRYLLDETGKVSLPQ
jgi:hypothetical protein